MSFEVVITMFWFYNYNFPAFPRGGGTHGNCLTRLIQLQRKQGLDCMYSKHVCVMYTRST